MKLWHKLFICTFLLFEVAYNASMIYFIETNFNNNLEKEIDRGLGEQLVLQSLLVTNSSLVIEQLGYSEERIRDYMQVSFRDYTRYFDQKGVYIELLDDQSNIIFSSFDLEYDGPREELSSPLADRRQYIIRDIDRSTYLFVTNQITIPDRSWKLTYIRNVTEVYTDRATQYGFYIRLNLFITVVLAAGLFGILWRLTRPVRELNQSVQSIAEGRYSDRVAIRSDDEIGDLAGSVNTMAKAVEDKMIELQSSAESKQHFIECLTHELKTPLTSIIGYADFLRTTKFNPEQHRKAVDYIYQEGKRLESLSFKLMDLILLDKASLTPSKVNIEGLCSEIDDTFSPLLLEKGMKLDIQASKGTLVADKELIKIVLTNLVDNAIKASASGDTISLCCEPQQTGGYLIEIRDQGKGIPEKDLPNVFEPFFMVDKSRTNSRISSGLGLAICANIIKLHEGSIQITSQLGEGTSVTVTIP